MRQSYEKNMSSQSATMPLSHVLMGEGLGERALMGYCQAQEPSPLAPLPEYRERGTIFRGTKYVGVTKHIGVFLLLSLLSACSLFSPIKPTVNTEYSLDPHSRVAIASHTSPQTLLVSTTKSSPILISKQMVFLRQAHHIEYYSTHRWAAPPAQMLTQSIATALQNTHQFRAVVASPFVGLVDLRLDTNLLLLQQEFCLNAPSQVRMQLEANLVNVNTNTIIASRRFDAVVPAEQDNPYGGVLAANAAAANILRQLTTFAQKYT